MLKKETLLKYLTEEEHISKLKAFFEREGEDILGEFIFVMESLNRLRKTNFLNLYRKKEEMYFGINGTPICFAAYAGNIEAVRYLINKGEPGMNREVNGFGFEGFTSELTVYSGYYFCCTILYQTERAYSFESEYFENIDPISFTYPEGRIDCLNLFLEAGHKCDFHNRANLRMLSLCRNRDLWEYLINHDILEPKILIIAAEYATHYRNEHIARWLFGIYMQHRMKPVRLNLLEG